MVVKVLKFSTSVSPLVPAFIDIELDGWLRFNGVHFLRDATVKSAQLTPMRDGKRMFGAIGARVSADKFSVAGERRLDEHLYVGGNPHSAWPDTGTAGSADEISTPFH